MASFKARDYARISIRTAWHGTALISALLLWRSYVFDVVSVSGSSMSPTLSPDYEIAGHEDTILVSKIRRSGRDYNDGYKHRSASDAWNTQRLKRGDIVTLSSPWSGQMGLKRVIALGGDLVVPEKRVRLGKGYRIPDPNEVVLDRPKGIPDKLRVPYGHLWVEGDDPMSSQDSRDYGPISHALIDGKAMAVVAPWKRAGWLEKDRPVRKTSTKVTPAVSMLPPEFAE